MTDSQVVSESGSKLGMNDVCVPVSDEDWNARRALIQHLYLEKNLTLKELIQCMIRNHGFRAS
jgi:hypothetical protein